MQFEIKRLKSYSKEEIINEVKRVASITAKLKLSQSDFKKHARVTTETIKRHFGSWENCLKEAGLTDKLNAYYKTEKVVSKPALNISNEVIINDMIRVADKLGIRTLSKRQFDQHTNSVNYNTVKYRFKNWENALTNAGLSLSPNFHKKYTDEECYENLLKVWTYYGRQPHYIEMSKAPSLIKGYVYSTRWKSWVRALHSFAEKINKDTSGSFKTINRESIKKVDILDIKDATIKINREDNRAINLGLRYTILKRDNFKCVMCGRSPAIDTKCILHVDHIKAFSKNGKTTIDNLRTLCKECNIGKGNKE